MATHVLLRFLRELEIRERGQLSAVAALVNRRPPRAHLRRERESRVVHAERLEDALAHHITSPSRLPRTLSTTFPAQSIFTPYSQRSPGSKSNGVRIEAIELLTTLGTALS
jgi:hypothetical protein